MNRSIVNEGSARVGRRALATTALLLTCAPALATAAVALPPPPDGAPPPEGTLAGRDTLDRGRAGHPRKAAAQPQTRRLPAATARAAIVLCAALAVSVSLALAVGARASVSAYPEPAYTKTAGNNTFWFAWQAVTGLDASGKPSPIYYLCLSTYHNGVLEEASNGANGPGSVNCTGSLRSSFTTTSGNNGFMPYGATTVLVNGHRYQMCAGGFRPTVLIWQHDITACAATVIDRDRPALGVTLANGAAVTRDSTVPVAISYADPTSPPWNGANGLASNWVCISQGAECAPGGQPNNDCSAPAGGFGNRINAFSCAISIGGGDGNYFFCAMAADAAIPDNAVGPNQFQFAVSNNANLSPTACDSVIVDRAGPSVTVSASATQVKVGELVTFTMAASDPNGLGGSSAWEFGDNTAQATGTTAAHTYTQAGTFAVNATHTDAAGNVGQGTRTITVTGMSNGNGNRNGGSSTGATPVGGDIAKPQLADRVEQESGGQGVSRVRANAIDLIAPKRLRAGKRTMLLALTAQAAGALKLAFLKGGRLIARKDATLGGAGTYTVRMKMPTKLKPGTYKLKVTFKAAGTRKATIKTVNVKVTSKRRRAATSVTPRRDLRGTPAKAGTRTATG